MNMIIITLANGVKYTEDEIKRLKKDDLITLASSEGLTFETAITKAQLVELVIKELGSKPLEEQDLDSKRPATEEELKERLAQIIGSANKMTEHLETLGTDEEKDLFIQASLEKVGLTEQMFRDSMNASDDVSLLDVVATDLPISAILPNLPIRVLEQRVISKLVSYPLMKLVNPEMVRNGVKQLIYKDFRDADNASGFSDIVIGDFNMGVEPRFTETYPVDTEIHKGYDVLDSKLNDVTINVSLFVSIVNDYALAIAHPIAKEMYKRFVTFLANPANYDEQINFLEDTTKEKAEQLYQFIIGKGTPSRSNLIVKPNGSTKALEYSMATPDVVLIMSSAYATKYKYDLSANTFQLGEINIPVSQIIVQDFTKLDEYNTDVATNKMTSMELILFEKGVYEEIVHYTGTKKVDTLKLKSVVHTYTRVGNFRLKNKYLGAFLPKA